MKGLLISNEYRNQTLEFAKSYGEPRDERKPYPDIIVETCATESVNPDEHFFYFDRLSATDKVDTTVSTGVSQSIESVDTDAEATFIDLVTKEHVIKISDLASAKENTIARFMRSIERGLNAYEIYKVLDLINTSTVANGYVEQLTSGTKHFTFENFVDMYDNVIEYADDFIYLVSALVDKDILLWDWKDDKNIAIQAQFKALNVRTLRIPAAASFNLDGVSTNAITDGNAYLVGRQTVGEPARPVLWARRRINDIDLLGGVIKQAGEKPERLVFVSPNPITITGSARHLAVALIGYEQIFGVVLNARGLYKFQRQ